MGQNHLLDLQGKEDELDELEFPRLNKGNMDSVSIWSSSMVCQSESFAFYTYEYMYPALHSHFVSECHVLPPGFSKTTQDSCISLSWSLGTFALHILIKLYGWGQSSDAEQ